MTDTAWLNDYVGIPYQLNGRTRAGTDCWGLLVLVWREQRRQELPDWLAPDPPTLKALAEAWAKGLDHVEGGELADRIDAPADWSIVLCGKRGRSRHAGLVIGGGVLHCAAESAGTVYDRLARFERSYFDRSFWRWRT